MKKTAVIVLLLAALLAFTGCGRGPKSYQEIKDFKKYVTLKEYKGLPYTMPDTSVSDYELQVAINEELQNSGYVTYEENIELKEGTVQLGDTVNINYKGLKDGVAFQGGTADNQSLTIGSGKFIGGFEEGLVGKAIGSDVSLNLTFPENYGTAELAGQAVVFEVKINSVTERANYRELTDDLAHTLNAEVSTAAEFTAALKAELESEKKADAESTVKSELWAAVIESASFKKLPENLLDGPTDDFITYYEKLATQYGYDDLDTFLAGNNITQESFDEQASAYAKDTVKSDLTAYAIAEAENYSPSKEELRKTAEEYAASSGYSDVDKYIETVGEDTVRTFHLTDYAVELILSNAVAQE